MEIGRSKEEKKKRRTTDDDFKEEETMKVNYMDYVVVLVNPTFAYLSVYFLLSVIGIFYPFLFALHLLDSIVQFRVLRGLLQIIFNSNGKIILQSAFVGIVFIWIYSVIGFWVFRFDFTADDSFYRCDTLFSCFVYTMNYGYRSGGGIADLLQDPETNSDGFSITVGRFFFDISFFLIITTILTAIFSGIVIDAFGAIRDKYSAVIEDMNSSCFICGLENTLFERHAEGFSKHFLEEHNMWSYLFFFLHLSSTDESEYNAQESFVADMIKAPNRNLNFFPVGRALCVKDVDIKKEKEEKEEKGK